jgi:hypothetical protein
MVAKHPLKGDGMSIDGKVSTGRELQTTIADVGSKASAREETHDGQVSARRYMVAAKHPSRK